MGLYCRYSFYQNKTYKKMFIFLNFNLKTGLNTFFLLLFLLAIFYTGLLLS